MLRGHNDWITSISLMKNENKFSIHYHALADGLTPVSLAPHIYWRLTGKDVLDHMLKLDANEVTTLNQQLLLAKKK